MLIEIPIRNRRWTSREVQDLLLELGRAGKLGSSWREGQPWGEEVQPIMRALGKSGAFGPEWVAAPTREELSTKYNWGLVPRQEQKPELQAKPQPAPEPEPKPARPYTIARTVRKVPEPEPAPPKAKIHPRIEHWTDMPIPCLLDDEGRRRAFVNQLLEEDQRELENMMRIVAMRARHGIEDRFDDFGCFDDLPDGPGRLQRAHGWPYAIARRRAHGID